MRKNAWRWLVLFVVFFGVSIGPSVIVQAQSSDECRDPLEGLDAVEIALLDEINALRLRQNLVHLVPNPLLNEIAYAHASDLAARPVGAIGDPNRSRDGAGLLDWLEAIGYDAYSDGYVANMVPYIASNTGPERIVGYWLDEAGRESALIFDTRYREVGIAYRFNESIGRHHYVLVFASQPDVIPFVIMPADAESPFEIRLDSIDSVVDVYVHDETTHPLGNQTHIGSLEAVRISEDPEFTDLLGESNLGWEPYTNIIPWRLGGGLGLHHVYVQMRDSADREIVMEVCVNLVQDGTLTPTDDESQPAAIASETPVIASPVATITEGIGMPPEYIAQQTQTAVAATQHVQQTVEAILTLTAMAMQGQTVTMTTLPAPSVSPTAVTPSLSPTVQETPTVSPTPTVPSATPSLAPTLTPTTALPGGAVPPPLRQLKLFWGPAYLLVQNSESEPVELRGVTFQQDGTGRSFGASEWLLHFNGSELPGWHCVLVFDAASVISYEEILDTATGRTYCIDVLAYIGVPPDQYFWDAIQGSYFVMTYDGQPVVNCDLRSSTACDAADG